MAYCSDGLLSALLRLLFVLVPSGSAVGGLTIVSLIPAEEKEAAR